MIPHLVATEIRDTLLDYLRSTWQLADRDLEKALLAFLSGPRGMFKGPWLRVGLPFSLAPKDAAIPLDVKPAYRPYLHQLLAWQRLSSHAGHEPQATLVTTGTGSGKTECFLYPILDHTLRAIERREKGIKAIILYPMNALAADQARRMAAIVHADPRMRGRLRIGMFVGGKGQYREMGPSHCIDDNDHLRRNPPDILLTNYKMLDLLLQRPRDTSLWQHNVPGRLRYLVLDELHTYDGAQGTDVACLVRRIGARLGAADRICPVGTSATMSGGPETTSELLKFANKVFDQEFSSEALIHESRLSIPELFGNIEADGMATLPSDLTNLLPAPQEEAEEHVRRVAHAWFGPTINQIAPSPDDFRVALGQAVLPHPLTRTLLNITSQRLLTWEMVCQSLRSAVPMLKERSEAEIEAIVAQLLTMLSWSKRQVETRKLPLVSVQVQLWVREVRKLLRDVTAAQEAPRFRWVDDGPGPDGTLSLPMTYCRECGHAGWVTCISRYHDKIESNYPEIARAWQEQDPQMTYLHHDASVRTDDGNPPAPSELDSRTHELRQEKQIRPQSIAIFAHKDEEGSKGRGQRKCPACGTRDAMRLLASRSASMTSVAVGHLFTTPLNTDRKLLAFSDSVQDASHRAGFFGGRTYRFALRSALLAVVPEHGSISLPAIAPAMKDHWSARLGREHWDADAAFVGAFLPQDLEFLAANVRWEQDLAERDERLRNAETKGEIASEPLPPPPVELVNAVEQRLRWEVTRELGVAARIGRTLEQSGCLSVTVDGDRFARAVDRAFQVLPEKFGALGGLGRTAFSQCLAGLLTRLRLRGGIFDPFLEAYIEHGGSDYHLNKQAQELLSPFGQFTSRPIFFSSEAKPRRFDSVQPAERRTWLMDWLGRSLGVDFDANEVRDLGAALMPILVEAGILGERTSGTKQKAWGLLPEALLVSRAFAWRRCPTCGNTQPTINQSATDPVGAPCARYRCEGRYEAVSEDDGRTATYYRRYYARGALGRVFPKEHTGLLDRNTRENLEVEFKQRPRPNAANLLSCTPTLEMGIDIGDLSATLLCSVPPNPASYVQRVGRAGRETGNALLVTFAATRPMDLYYFEDPLAVMAGAIQPPGCFLDAPEVLKRQALAFCFDALARKGHKMPGRVRDALNDEDFPKHVLAEIGQQRVSLQAAFLELFARQLTPESRKPIGAFFEPEGDGLAPIERRLVDEIAYARSQRDLLAARVRSIQLRMQKLATDDEERKSVENPEKELSELAFEKKYVWAELSGLLEKDFWGYLCDRSVLPNYAFPEPGVTLDAYVRREGDADVQRFSWIRPPASAISELAPYNTFYGSARHVVVQNLDLKHAGTPGWWQACKECHHLAEIAKQGDEKPATCPACGADGFSEMGRRLWLTQLTHVRAFARHRDATVGDESDDRERAYYVARNFYDPAGSRPLEAWVNREKGFGFELLPRLTLRRINFGQRDGKVGSIRLAGEDVAEVAFQACTDCGQVQRAPELGQDPNWTEHWMTCASRKLPRNKQKLLKLHLMRSLTTEALRLVVPISDYDWERRLPNLRGALRLGARKYFGGDPDHLDVDVYDEPLPDQEGRRRYVVLLDLVPGGTGMLADLAHGKGAKLKQLLLYAKNALENCPCNVRGDEAKACHLCLYAYREQTALPYLDRTIALAEIDRLLEAFEKLSQDDTVGTLAQESVLESELEHRFIARLETCSRDPDNGIGFTRIDDASWRLSVGGRTWKVKAQVTVGEDQTEYICRPDFIFYPEKQESAVLPIAVFLDGSAYHVQPRETRARIEDDFRKRWALSRSGNFLTWSITWRDVNEHQDATTTNGIPPWWPDEAFRTQMQKLMIGLKAEGIASVLNMDPLTGLLAILKDPLKLRTVAALAAFLLLHGRGKRATSMIADVTHDEVREAAEPNMIPLEAIPGGDTLVAKSVFGENAEGMMVVSAPQESLNRLYATPEVVRLTLRLDDRHSRRKTSGFQTVWRQALRAWNLLQALPGAQIASSEQYADASISNVVPAITGRLPSDIPPPRPPSDAPTEKLSAADEAVLIEITDEAARNVVRQLVLRGAKLPTVPHEVQEGLKGSRGEVEFAWPDEQVGAYLDEQRETAELLRARGFTMFPIERGLNEVELAKTLRL